MDEEMKKALETKGGSAQGPPKEDANEDQGAVKEDTKISDDID